MLHLSELRHSVEYRQHICADYLKTLGSMTVLVIQRHLTLQSSTQLNYPCSTLPILISAYIKCCEIDNIRKNYLLVVPEGC